MNICVWRNAEGKKNKIKVWGIAVDFYIFGVCRQTLGAK